MSGVWSSVRVAGGLIPPDVLSAVLAGEAAGMSSSDYHLGGEPPREAAARVWPHLRGAWRRFRDDLARLPDGDPAIGLTRERWLTVLLADLGYGRVPMTPSGGLTVGDRSYPVSHLWGATPIHLLGWGVPLDRRTPGVAGAAQKAPYSMVQELLNRTDEYLWAIVSNGRTLWLLRDSTSMSGQAYVEFDLQAIFDGDLYADFALLFLTVHQSRVEVPDGGRPADCWLERWRTSAAESGVRALALLRDGVQEALVTLGNGFLRHRANTELRERLGSGEWRPDDLHAALLRTVYRLLFWAVAEDRDVLLDRHAPPEAKDRYARYFSSARLRGLALRRHGTPHADVWAATTLVMQALNAPEGEPRLGLPGLGGLFAAPDVDVLAGARLDNVALLSAVRSLSIVSPKGQKQRTVDFRHLGAEELGSIYESLLELIPRHDPTSQRFSLELLAGNDRKTSGSYYTPSSLVELVLDTALDPVLDDAEKTDDPATALLALKVCDPAIGSGHFMVAAARRIATRLATARSGELDPTPDTYTEALHDVVGLCIYGVDVNPMAADLAKVSLWLEAMTPGRPLSFLDAHIKVGNALLGTTPALLAAGIPDAAYTPLTGDDKATVRAWKKDNTAERDRQGSLFDRHEIHLSSANAGKRANEVTEAAVSAESLAEINWAAARYQESQAAEDAIRARRLADAWCAAFLGPKAPDDVPITTAVLDRLDAGTASAAVVEAVDAISARHRLFHWHLAFPEAFAVAEDGPANTPTGWTGGFDAMLGNPPWERVKLQEQEFFAARAPEIANAKNAAARKKAIAALAESDPPLLAEFDAAKRAAEAESSFYRQSGRYPLCGVGDVNTYSIFAEHFRTTLDHNGRSGIVTPTGLATDATTAAFFADTLHDRRLAAFYDFDNEAKIFPGVHHAFRFAVSSMTGGQPQAEVRLGFLNRHVEDAVANRFQLSADEILLLNPNTGTLPVFRSRRDAEITLACYRSHPVLIRDGDVAGNPWGLRFATLFHMANDSGDFRTPDQLSHADFDGWKYATPDTTWLPLYEAKMLSHWSHRFSTYADATQAQLNMQTLPRLSLEQLDDPEAEPLARYWVERTTVDQHVPNSWDRDWFLGWRDITGQEKWRTFVPSALPKAAVNDKFLLAMPVDPTSAPLLQAVWSSFAFDYISRQKISGTGMKYFLVKQLACPRPTAFEGQPAWSAESLDAFVRARVVELTYTSYRIKPYAVDVAGGEPGEPFRWLPERREQLRAELDAAMLHLYGLDRADAEHVLDSFLVLRKYEERDHDEFRTKRLVLTAYDAMTRAVVTGVPFASPLDPPPGLGPRHGPRP